MTRALPRPATLVGGVVAGVAAGVSIVACIALMNLVVWPAPGFTLGGFFTFSASALIGKAAYASDASVGLGVALHVLVSIGWAIGYAVLAERQPQLTSRPLISGAAFGLIVYFAMQLVLVAANLYRTPTPRELAIALLAHLVCYGIPVALIVGRLRRPA